MNDKEQFIAWIDENVLNISSAAREQLLKFADLVIEGSERMGLVARGDLPRLYMRHMREAVAPALLDAIPVGAKVLDVGSGGGFPGIPLAILKKDIEIELLEPRHRRAAFLERAVLVLGLENASVHTASMDAFSQQPGGARFDWIVSRGVAWTAPMVRCLGRVALDEAVLIRFGSPDLTQPGVRVLPIDGEAPRAIQIWPRSTWEGLPQAR
jgi:16S rRNA (guanine527-N7)-methyltransferase